MAKTDSEGTSKFRSDLEFNEDPVIGTIPKEVIQEMEASGSVISKPSIQKMINQMEFDDNSG